MTINEKAFNNMLKKAIKERKELVAQGLENYPIRTYEIIITTTECGENREFTVKKVGGYYTVEEDKKHIYNTVKGALDQAFYIAKAFSKRSIKVKSIDIKLLREY